MTAKVTADLASLRPLQPWLGTLAVLDGRARIDVDARGTLADPNLAGTMTGDALRFDLPQFGVHLRDGRLRARLADRALVLDEFSFAGGDGRFTAKGTLARAANATDRANASANVTWEATDFTVVNRPDLRLVADGKGTLALAGGKLVLAGGINIDEGRVVYERTTDGRLSDDVVIVGQPRPTAADATARTLPLTLDLQVALGRDFRFSGEGLETRLAGNVRVTTTPAGTIAAKGTIRAVAGTYYVFGQRLDIDRGRLIFDGPADNPALDVVALAAQRVGGGRRGSHRHGARAARAARLEPAGARRREAVVAHHRARGSIARAARTWRRCPRRRRHCSARISGPSRRRSPTRSASTTSPCATAAPRPRAAPADRWWRSASASRIG